MIQSNSKCPYCYQPVINLNNQLGWGANQNYAQPQPYPNNTYWQPVPNQGPVQAGPIIANNQGFNAQPYVVQPNAGNASKPGKFCGFSILFLILAVGLLVIRIKMNSCAFWGAVDCGTKYNDLYCCDSSTCYDIFDSRCAYLVFYENFGLVMLVTAAIALCFALSLSFFVQFLRKRKLQQFQALNNRYVAMANWSL